MNAVVIYAHADDRSAVTLAKEIALSGNFRVIISGQTKSFIQPEGVTVLDGKGRGLGAALKRAFAYIQEKLPECKCVATVTNAARHNAEEIIRLCRMAEGRDEILIGTTKEHISALKTSIETALFSLVGGAKLKDIHSSLRVFGSDKLAVFGGIPVDSAAYEIEMLLTASRSGIDVCEVDIEADDNKRRRHDWRHLKSVYASTLMFLFSSLFAFGLEFALLLGIEHLCSPLGAGIALTIGVAVSRVISCIVNYAMNRSLVFKSSTAIGGSVFRYFVVAAVVLVINYLLLRLCVFVIGWPLWISKFIVETALFFVNFVLQGKFVY